MNISNLRKSEFSRLKKNNQTYLDYTGSGLYGDSQIKKHLDLLQNNVFGNPHSDNPSSRFSTQLITKAKADVLKFFNADSKEYCVIFTQNASGAIKLVGESFPFEKGGKFLICADNHNSVNGVREFAKMGKSETIYFGLNPEMRVDMEQLEDLLKKTNPKKNNLFAYPAQSNFSGVKHPLDLIKKAKKAGFYTLLDAAAFVPTNNLDLSKHKPDFVSLSFYKMFGYPTGIGGLVAKSESLQILKRPWFSGGTIWAVSVAHPKHIFAKDADAFEDGTVNFLGIPAISIGLDFVTKVGMEKINNHTSFLTEQVLRKISLLKHKNGNQLVKIYGPINTEGRGATIAFNFLTPNGDVVDERVVEKLASNKGISLRSGCFCNPGAGEHAFGIKKKNLRKVYETNKMENYDKYLEVLEMPSGGAIRISFGIASTKEDVEMFLKFAESFLDKKINVKNLRLRGHC